jgi:hypothetical protein
MRLVLRALALVGDSSMQFHWLGSVCVRIANNPMNIDISFRAQPIEDLGRQPDVGTGVIQGFLDEFMSDRRTGESQCDRETL